MSETMVRQTCRVWARSGRKASQAYTLLEIMIVVTLVGMLAAIAIPQFVRARSQSQLQACLNNLRQIDNATQQWALETQQAPTATVTYDKIYPYLKSAVVCPASGFGSTFATAYTLTTVSNKPLCRIIPGTHILPEDTTN